MTTAVGHAEHFEAVTEMISERLGFWFSVNRLQDVHTGIQRAMKRAGIAGIDIYLKRLNGNLTLLDDLIAEITIGETYFFRDQNQFDFIREEVIPDIVSMRGPQNPIRMWSAGCSTGEEAYSLAILSEESGWASRTGILATDVSRTRLAAAKKARYGAWSLRNQSQGFITRYFSRKDNRFTLDERFRKRVEFAYLNLIFDIYPSFMNMSRNMDLILCRNVLIYFDPQTIEWVAKRFYDSLADGGWLITGASDPPLNQYAPFETVISKAGVVYRRGNRVSGYAPAPSPPPAPLPLPLPPPLPAASKSCPENRVSKPLPAPAKPPAILDDVRAAALRGDHERVLTLTNDLMDVPKACILRVKALAGMGDCAAAEKLAARAKRNKPVSAELGFLHAVLLINLNRYTDAKQALRQVLYLDRSLASVHFTLGSVLHHLGELNEAARSYRNARDLADTCPADETVPLSEGERADRLVAAATAQLELIGNSPESPA